VRLPDWRKSSEYCFPGDFPDNRWAWEFLRRNPKYRQDWDAAVFRHLSNTGEFEEVADLEAFLKAGGQIVGTGELWKDDPADPGFYLPVEEAEKWRLHTGMLNPSTDEPTWLSFDLDFGTVHFMRKGSTFNARGPAYPIVEFDLHLSLKPQLEAIVEPLERARKHLNIKSRRAKHHRKLWPLYLRLLDADLDQRLPSQIANALEKEPAFGGIDERKVWNQLKAARSMTEPEGYLSIFLSSSSS
jgi:hypothetical protein